MVLLPDMSPGGDESVVTDGGGDRRGEDGDASNARGDLS